MIKKYLAAVLAVFIVLTVTSCSSSSKNTVDVYNLRSQAEAGLEAGNREAGQGNFTNALYLIDESKRKAILVDDTSLIIRSSLSRGNVLFALGRTDEAFAEWEQAVGAAEKAGDTELLSACRIFRARGDLISGRASAQSVLDEVNREQANIVSNRLYIAFSWQLKGLALRALGVEGIPGSFTEAEAALTQSLEIHERDNYLENASYDWYTIASIRSLAGDISGALSALESSIAIDRRIENSWGLAASWRAMGDVYRKSGSEQDALAAYNRARAIYIAMGNEYEAAQIQKRINNE